MGLTLENRSFIQVQKVALLKPKPTWTPSIVPDDCPCEPFEVFGLDGGESWQKDITGAWIKMFSDSDVCRFVLYNEEGNETLYSPPNLPFVNEQYSFYTQIDWTDVLNSDGIGCYTLKIEYTIAGVTDVYEWGEYKLFEFNIPMVEKTVRSKVILNSNQLIEGIDFSGSKVIDTLRFDGWFGDSQPQTEIDNIIYSDRKMNKVTRENIWKYTLFSKNLKRDRIEYLCNLHFLSEDEIYISDFNPLNPVDYYLDYPVILSESPKIEYEDTAKKSSIEAYFNDKYKKSKSSF